MVRGEATEIVDIGHFLPLAFADHFAGRRSVETRAVLLVDDSAFFRNLLTPVLQSAGYRVAAAKLTVRDEPAYSWTPAVLPGELVPMQEEFGYEVKSSTGAFFDLAAAPAIDRLASDDEVGNCDLIDALGKVGGGRGPANVTDPQSGLNVVAFSTGWGDGVYPTWVGRNTAGDPVAFVTDFFVINRG